MIARICRGALAVLASHGLACLVLVLLFVITWLGTLDQVDLGLHAAQKKYFESWFAVWPTGIPFFDRQFVVPLPGGQLLMLVLFVNLLVGGMIRMKLRRRTVGIMIIHVGIVVLLAAGFVKFYHATDGHLTLYEGERCDEFQSYYAWEIAITRDLGNGQFREYLIPGDDFTDLAPSDRRTFRRDDLPFELELTHYLRNGSPRPKGPMFEVAVPVVDGFYLHEFPLAQDAEQNVACAYATVIPRDGSGTRTGILVGRSIDPSSTARNPWVVDLAGVTWAIELRHTRYPLPYTVHLDDFTAAFHPRTNMASRYESQITMIEGDTVQPVLIQMNDPLRAGGHILFQSSYGPADARPGSRMYSVFSVVRNPSDHWPLIACVIIAIGLLVHFGVKLVRFILSQSAKARAA